MTSTDKTEPGAPTDPHSQVLEQIGKDGAQFEAQTVRPSRRKAPRETVITLQTGQVRALAVEKLAQAEAEGLSTFDQIALGDQAAALLLAASPNSGYEFVVRPSR